MPLQQFDEREAFSGTTLFDDTYVVGIALTVWVTNAQTSRIDTLTAINNDTIDHNLWVDWTYQDGTHPGIQLTIPAGAGYGGVPVVDVLEALFGAAFHYLCLAGGQSVACGLAETVNTGKSVVVIGNGGKF